jgi:hypothetical protein
LFFDWCREGEPLLIEDGKLKERRTYKIRYRIHLLTSSMRVLLKRG